jgi:hypothetical protein
MRALRNRAVVAFLLFNMLAGGPARRPDREWRGGGERLCAQRAGLGFLSPQSFSAQDMVATAFKGRAMGLFDATMYLGGALGDGVGGWLWRAKRAGSSILLSPSAAGPSSEEPPDA